MQDWACLERARHRACERNLKPVEHPGDAERDHYERVEPAPGQAVETRRRASLEDRRLRVGSVDDVLHGSPFKA